MNPKPILFWPILIINTILLKSCQDVNNNCKLPDFILYKLFVISNILIKLKVQIIRN